MRNLKKAGVGFFISGLAGHKFDPFSHNKAVNSRKNKHPQKSEKTGNKLGNIPKTIEDYSVSKCVSMSLINFQKLIYNTSSGKLWVERINNSLEFFTNRQRNVEVPNKEIPKKLSEYLDIKVTSVHMNDKGYTEVNIMYK